MPSDPIPVLFVHFGEQWIRGSERLLLDLLTHLDRRRVEPIIWCNGAPMAAACRAASFTTYHSDFTYFFDNDSAPFDACRYGSFVRQGIRLVRQHEIRVLHSNSAAPSQFLVPVSRATRVPLLAHLHSYYLRRSRFICLLHQASLVVGVSQQVIGDFLRDGMAAERLKVIYNGVDFTRLERRNDDDLRQKLCIADDTIVVSTVGYLVRGKGHDVVINALKILNAKSNVHLLVAGEGPERSNLERLTAELEFQARVHFLGHCDDPGSVYRATDIIALGSRADAFGLVLAEAGYFAIPAVATCVGGIPEVVQHEKTGLLVAPDNPAAFATALARLVGDPAHRRQLGIAAKERVEQLFSSERMVADFHETYDQLALVPRWQLGWLGAAASLNPYLRLLHLRRRAAISPSRP